MHVRNLANDMRRGKWELNGESIKISKDGTLVDGQHRLEACIESNTSFTTIVAYGVEASTQTTIDLGVKRKLTDQLIMRGYKDSAPIASLANAIICYENGGIEDAIISSRNNVSISDALGRIERDQRIQEIVLKYYASRKFRSLKSSGILFLLIYITGQRDKEDSDYFFDKLVSGEGLYEGDPILTLRNCLIGMSTNKFKWSGSMSATSRRRYVTAICIKAWNKFISGEKCYRLYFSAGGKNAEKMPELIFPPRCPF